MHNRNSSSELPLPVTLETVVTIEASPPGNISSIPILDHTGTSDALGFGNLNPISQSIDSNLNSIPTYASPLISSSIPLTSGSMSTALPKNPPSRTHSMTTRSMNNIFKPKQIRVVTKHPLPSTIEPTCVSQSVAHPKWREAMYSELTTLMQHGTWDLVTTPENCKPIGCKGVFRVKRKADGSVDQFKSPTCCQGV